MKNYSKIKKKPSAKKKKKARERKEAAKRRAEDMTLEDGFWNGTDIPIG